MRVGWHFTQLGVNNQVLKTHIFTFPQQRSQKKVADTRSELLIFILNESQ